jgi:hypothetical protein
MTHPTPCLKGFATKSVALSALTGSLQISIPDSADIRPEHDVRAIFGANDEKPDWAGDYVQIGRWNDETGEVERAQDFSVDVPKKALEKYVNKTVTVRYQSRNESSDATSSEPLQLRIEP